jgi:hypothetical protein
LIMSVPDGGYSYLMEGYSYLMKVIRTWWKVIRTWWKVIRTRWKVIRTWWRLFVPDEGYLRRVLCSLNYISTFLLTSVTHNNFDVYKIIDCDRIYLRSFSCC